MAGVPANANPAQGAEPVPWAAKALATTTRTPSARPARVVPWSWWRRATTTSTPARSRRPTARGVITVAAVARRAAGPSPVLNFGTSVELAAPGGDTTIETDGNPARRAERRAPPRALGAEQLRLLPGTSLATPRGWRRTLVIASQARTVAESWAALLNTVRPAPPAPGCGRASWMPYAAIQYVKGGSTTPQAAPPCPGTESNSTRAA